MPFVIIKLQISRPENREYFSVPEGTVVKVDMEDYLCGAVAAEMGEAPSEALKAQAIAARTYALTFAAAGKQITDDASKHQAFRASRIDWPGAVQAVYQTAGQVLFHNGKALSSCLFSACNGGRTVSSEERWGGARPWLIAQEDPWDAAECAEGAAAGQSVRKGHGVGMSQYGAIYAAKRGYGHKEILAFYYPGTAIMTNYGEGETMVAGTAKIKASALVAYARSAVGGGYCFGASGQVCSLKQRQVWANDNPAQAGNLLGLCAKWDGKRVWDCSGILRGAWRELLEYRSGGATTIFNSWASKTGTIDTMPDVPGIAVFRANAKTPKTKEHIGVYVGGGLVVDARGSNTGVVIGTLQSYGKWTHWAYLDDVDYTQAATTSAILWRGIVKTNKGNGIGLWENSEKLTQYASVPDGEAVEVIGTADEKGFALGRYNSTVGVVDTQYLRKIVDAPTIENKDGAKGIFIQTDEPEAFLEALRRDSIMTHYEADDKDNGGNEQ